MPLVIGMTMWFGLIAHGQLAEPPDIDPAEVALDAIRLDFQQQIEPLLQTHCIRCHNAEHTESGVRIDRLRSDVDDQHVSLWLHVAEQVAEESMPPADEPQPTSQERAFLSKWVERAIIAAQQRRRDKHGTVRRLTVAQYRNTLRDLLGLQDDLTHLLPPDSVSKDGFLNHNATMLLSPLLVEAYFDIAQQALDRSIVDPATVPLVQKFRMDFGSAINPTPCPDTLVLGANSLLLNNQDFVVTQLTPNKPFACQPFFMRTRYDFIEGYQGNDTVRDWRHYDSIYHAVFACMRGTEGYPKGEAYQVIPAGLLLRPAIPSTELFGESSTYGPNANFKISLRELPNHGLFRVTVNAACYDDGLLLDPDKGTPAAVQDEAEMTTRIANMADSSEANLDIERSGIYQVDVTYRPSAATQQLQVTLGSRFFSGKLPAEQVETNGTGDASNATASAPRNMALMLVHLPSGPLRITARSASGGPIVSQLRITRCSEQSSAARQFREFQARSPLLGVHLGLRRDCGSTLAPVGSPQAVADTNLRFYEFEDAIGNYPNPDVEEDNVNYLAGVREIAVHSEYTDGRDRPRLLIRSIDFEGPFYSSWPPPPHRKIFFESPFADQPERYARDVIQSFASRAYRRPVASEELTQLMSVWQQAFAETGHVEESVKQALLVVLSSPQFLFLTEASQTPEAEPLDAYELASKLSYFLWNTAPDQPLLELAATDSLHGSLTQQITRMIDDPRFSDFTHEFVSQWLQLDKLDVVETDRTRYPSLTREAKAALRQEPIEFVEHLIRNNLPIRNLVQSEFILANEVVANYYGLAEHCNSGFAFVSLSHGNSQLGGILTQAAILAGLSNGRESNPVKRGAWFARKIIAEPPDDPPPNVPALPEDEGSRLSLRERLERHRDQKGCSNCHAGIDPWGLPLEEFDAGGLLKNQQVAASATLPDQTNVHGIKDLKNYLATKRLNQVTFSFLKHLATYATGRTLNYNEIEFLRRQALELSRRECRMRDLVQFVVQSELFLEK